MLDDYLGDTRPDSGRDDDSQHGRSRNDGGDRPERRRPSGRVILSFLLGLLGAAAAVATILGVTVTGIVSCDDQSPVATITSHRDGNLVSARATTVGGTSTGMSGSSDYEIWVVVVPQVVGGFYPQGAAPPTTDGTWAVSNVHVGLPAPKDSGLTFMIHAVVADKSASAALHSFFQLNALNSPGLGQLPPGAKVTDTVTVTRQ